MADYVIQVIREQYPDLQIPFHSRWRHFEAGGVPRLTQLDGLLAGLTPVERAAVKFDLVIISVLLDAGAGEGWQYYEQETGLVFRRSEGLAVASFQMFYQGTFSTKDGPWADAQGLQGLTEEVLAAGFQVNPENPLVGVIGRLELLQRLGRSLLSSPQMFGHENPRPGQMVNYLLERSSNGQLAAETVLSAVLEGLGDIWPGRLEIAGVNLGDVWPISIPNSDLDTDPAFVDQFKDRSSGGLGAGLVPFHKLSQWLTYSPSGAIARTRSGNYWSGCSDRITRVSQWGFMSRHGAVAGQTSSCIAAASLSWVRRNCGVAGLNSNFVRLHRSGSARSFRHEC